MIKNLSLALTLTLTLLSSAALAEDGWLIDYNRALAESKSSGKPLLIDFTGSDWCTWCRMLDQRVFAKKDFKDWAVDKVVLLKLDFPSDNTQPEAMKKLNKSLAERYKIRAYPSVLVIDAEGKVHGKTGFKATPKAFIASISKAVENATVPPKPVPSDAASGAPASAPPARRGSSVTSEGLRGRLLGASREGAAGRDR
jgi:protein disulfide-isomerase